MKRDDLMKTPIIDCHCHVYPDKIAAKAVESIGSFYDLDMFYDGKYSTLIEHGSEIGIRHYVVFSVATTPAQVSSINRFIADTAEKSNGLVTGLGTIHPLCENPEDVIEEILSLGLKGVKMHHDFQKVAVDSPECFRIFGICEKHNLPVMLHTGDSRYDFSNPERVERVLQSFPGLTVIGAHFGGWSCWQKAAETLSRYENFYVDCSSSFDWLTAEQATCLVEAYTADRVVFGTDFPMWSHKKEIERFYKMNLTKEQQEKILYKNAVRIFSIDEKSLF